MSLRRKPELVLKTGLLLLLFGGVQLQAQDRLPALPPPPPWFGTSAPTGMIGGTVMADDGSPVAGAMVISNRTLALGKTSTYPLGTTTTDGKGNYSFGTLAPGSYLVCVQAPGTALIDPCQWSPTPPAWNLTAGQSAILNITLKTGVFVHIRVDDPEKSIAAKERAVAGPSFVAGVTTNAGRFQNAERVAVDASGYNLRVVVPRDLDIALALNSGSLTFEDEKGRDVKANDSTVLRVKAGDKEPLVRFKGK